ncbi:hypothetical protein BBJ28_00011924 [Nothophytophthora sp. Chile5]|nr:hypothetical protein BBJ28_00011924 [Nothophytophthora sp. Chile5]
MVLLLGCSMAKECRAYTNVTPVAPPLPIPYGTHHTKMLVALYPDKVRVAIFTANFLSGDWNCKTQGVWYQDFDLKVVGDSGDEEEGPVIAAASPAAVHDFEADLVLYLSSLGHQVKLFCGELKRFDYSTARVALIPSVPGVHKGKGKQARQAHCKDRVCSLDPEASSNFVVSRVSCVQLDRLLKAFNIPETDNPLICQRNSTQGWNAGRSIPCPLKNMKSFLHKYLRKWTPPAALHRQNAMPHIKTYARFDPRDEKAGTLDWAIMTSSNMSKAAWGAFQKNKTQFMIRSYELGVMFLPPLLTRESSGPRMRLSVIGSKAAEDSGVVAREDSNTQQQATILLPLPFQFPLKTYDPKKDEPWVWDLTREDSDIFGSAYIPH